MPKYDYRCNNKECNHTEEYTQKITEDKIRVCPKCLKETYERLITNTGGFNLKGSGWFNKGGY